MRISYIASKISFCESSFWTLMKCHWTLCCPSQIPSAQQPQTDGFLLNYHIDGLVQDSSNSSALALELLQSCAKPSISPVCHQWRYSSSSSIPQKQCVMKMIQRRYSIQSRLYHTMWCHENHWLRQHCVHDNEAPWTKQIHAASNTYMMHLLDHFSQKNVTRKNPYEKPNATPTTFCSSGIFFYKYGYNNFGSNEYSFQMEILHQKHPERLICNVLFSPLGPSY